MTNFFNESIKAEQADFETISLVLWDMIFSDVTEEDIVNYRLRLEF